MAQHTLVNAAGAADKEQPAFSDYNTGTGQYVHLFLALDASPSAEWADVRATRAARATADHGRRGGLMRAASTQCWQYVTVLQQESASSRTNTRWSVREINDLSDTPDSDIP